MSNPEDSYQPPAVVPITKDEFDRVVAKAGVDPEALARPETGDSAPTDRTDSEPEQMATAALDSLHDADESMLYCWQMFNGQFWNIIGVLQPQTGVSLPMITSSFDVAWQAFDLAQEHATRHNTRCRLACFKFDSLMAVVVPNE